MKKSVFPLAIAVAACLLGCNLDSGTTNPDDRTDTTAPADVNLSVTKTGSGRVSLSWSDPSDEDYDHLLLTWTPGGTSGTTIAKGTTTYEITGLTNGNEYSITGKSVDTSGNASSGDTITILVPEDPMDVVYISTATELAAMDDTPESLNDYYILTEDIDLAGVDWAPIGSEADPFMGILEGNNCTIQNLSVDVSGSLLGLFGYIGSGSIVCNLVIENGDITGGNVTGEYLGLIAGYVFEGIIQGCTTGGSVKGLGSGPLAGGIVGGNAGTVKNCSSSASVTGSGGSMTSYSGGIVGFNIGNIDLCSASGDVIGVDAAGGLVGGSASSGVITNSYADGTVTSTGDYNSGGLAGVSHGTITGCHATGSVDGHSRVGGLVGWSDGGTITGSYASGTVTGTEDGVGGLLGRAEAAGTISDCYATGNVTTTTGDYAGGLVGYTESPISICYATGYAKSTFGSYVGGLVGYTTQPVSESYAVGNVSGYNMLVGGLIGYTSEAVTNSYATGSVEGNMFIGGFVGGIDAAAEIDSCFAVGLVAGSTSVGGLTGGGDGTVTDSFYDSETSGMSDTGNGTPKTTAEMRSAATFTETDTVGLDNPWDFAGNPNDDTGNDDHWNIDGSTNGGYPYLDYFE